MKKLLHSIFLIALCFMSLSAFAAAGVTIQNIEIQNNQRIEAETVKSYLDLSVGSSFSSDKVDSSIKKMFASGLFTDVKIYMKSSTLVVNVQENPIINKIAFEGNKKINDEALLSEIGLTERDVYSKGRVQAAVKRIQDLYRKSGRFSVKVEPKAIKLDQNRINLVFEIDEGKKATVKKILFLGNKHFDDEKLKKILNTKENHWYLFFSSSDTYDADKLAYDSELLRKFYLSKGYADFKVTSSVAEITKDRESFVITFTLEEGEKYKFGAIDTKSNLRDLKPAQIRDVIKTKQDDTFNATLIEKSIDDITSKLNDLGYAFVEVNTDYDKDDKNRIVGVTYTINEGPKVYINKINIKGNVRTLDKVIRREFRLAEGDPYNAAKIRRTRQRLQNLGYFDKVDLKTTPTSTADKIDLDLDVKEKSTGELSFGAGVSSVDGLLGNASIRERNLLGEGQDLKLALQKSSYGSNVDLGYTEPYFMERELATGVDLFRQTYSNQTVSAYDSATSGITTTGTYALTENLSHTLKYSFSDVNISDVASTASTYIQQQQGTNTTSSIGHILTYDRRDSKLDPTTGYIIKFSEDVAGAGGSDKFFRNELSAAYYTPVINEDVILSLTAKGGNIFGLGGQQVRINDSFFIGGPSLRGFRISGIGPRDSSTRDALGGENYYTGSTELTFPIGLPAELGFKGSTFMDFGSLWGTPDQGPTVVDDAAIRASLGFGLAWSSPLGPIKISFAEPIVSDHLDNKQNVLFDFGTKF